jgi:hypothetical protein
VISTDTKTSLLSTGTSRATGDLTDPPSLEFVLDGVPAGGNGIVEVPHDSEAFAATDPPLRPAFLQTSRSVAELDLLRYYSDQSSDSVVDGGFNSANAVGTASSLHRPFIQREVAYSLTANASGADSRGIVIDDSPRRACKSGMAPGDPRRKACARLPARVYFANRAPASIIFGEIGQPIIGPPAAPGATNSDLDFDPDRLVLFGNEPLTDGPSKLYLAPIIDGNGRLALRLFIVCFDSATIFVWDPAAQRMENIIRVGPGPFAMAFDPFDVDDVARRCPAVADPVADVGAGLGPAAADCTQAHGYRFAYVASFTDSFVQVLDLDQRNPATFERVVFTLGTPTLPKGTL